MSSFARDGHGIEGIITPYEVIEKDPVALALHNS